MNTAEYLVKKLEELGVNDFFGLPGDYNFNIEYKGIKIKGSNVIIKGLEEFLWILDQYIIGLVIIIAIH